MISDNSNSTTSTSSVKAQKKYCSVNKMSEEEYVRFLDSRKNIGRVKMVGKWKSFNKAVLHKCLEEDCQREWKPKPSRMVTEIGYCPSCIMSWSNKEERFQEKPWVSSIPNTIYFYLLKDSTGKVFHKIGRTEHADPNDRFSLQERKNYKMNLLDFKRLGLENTIIMENKFKRVANLVEFPEKTFHGKNETFISDNPKGVWEEVINI